MHRVMTVSHHVAMLMEYGHSHWKWPEWRRGGWFKVYEDGIPSWNSFEIGTDFADILILNAEVYLNYVRDGGFFSRLPQAIEEWRSHHTVSEDR